MSALNERQRDMSETNVGEAGTGEASRRRGREECQVEERQERVAHAGVVGVDGRRSTAAADTSMAAVSVSAASTVGVPQRPDASQSYHVLLN